MSAVTTRRVIEEVVHPSMDGRVHNLQQARLLANLDTPEVDSVIEHIDTLPGFGVPAATVEALRRKVWLLVESNGREGQSHRTVAGNGEQIARDLRHVGPSLKRPEISRRLGPILDAISEVEIADPSRDWSALADLIETHWPRETLLSASLLHELGGRRARKLTALLGEGTGS